MTTFRPVSDKSRLVLVDASGFVYRAYHANPSIVRRSDKHPVGAISGFCGMLWHLAMRMGTHPTHIGVVFDAGGKNFRHKLYPQYKGTRPPVPADLLAQFAPIRRATAVLGMAMIEARGHEADDIIATYARRAARLGTRVTIVSTDKDLCQLVVDGSITMYDPQKQAHIDTAAVEERLGVPPRFVPDLLALMGDTADNIPGVPSIGIKGAAKLIKAHGSVEAMLAAANSLPVKARDLLLTHAAILALCKKLVLLDDQITGLPSLATLAVRQHNVIGFLHFLKEYDLSVLSGRIQQRHG